MIVDTSAVVAIFKGEPSADGCLRALHAAPWREMSAATAVELATVLAGWNQLHGHTPYRAYADLMTMLTAMRIDVVAVAPEHVQTAVQARVEYGRGFGGPGKLNYGDCFAYALAKLRNAPLLFVGDDFSQTDVVSALA